MIRRGAGPSRLSDDEVEADFSPRRRAERLLTLLSGCTCQARTNGAVCKKTSPAALPLSRPPPLSFHPCRAPIPGGSSRRDRQEIRGVHQRSLPNCSFSLPNYPSSCVGFASAWPNQKQARKVPCSAPRNICNLDRSCIGKLVAKSPAVRAGTPLSPRRPCIVMHARFISRRRNHSPRCGITTNLFEGVEQIKTHGGQAIVIAVAVHLGPCVS